MRAPALIRAENLVKTFGQMTAVDGLSLEVFSGEIFAFLGPNGAGKTTTLRMLTTLARPTRGTVWIDGLDTTKHPMEVRRRFGVVFQEPTLDVALTAYENMDLHGVLHHMPRRLRAARTEELLKVFELWDRRAETIQSFSGGLKRRLEIARGLMHAPKILFLDEPTLGLDPQSRNELWTQLRHMNEVEGVTVFLTTHYMHEAERIAHRVSILNGGRVAAQGTPQALRQQTGAAESLEQAFLALTKPMQRDEKSASASPAADAGARGAL